MSGFDPSVLERKDRDELSQIAESLGQKPPSRAAKADIVDLILRLAGVSDVPGRGQRRVRRGRGRAEPGQRRRRRPTRPSGPSAHRVPSAPSRPSGPPPQAREPERRARAGAASRRGTGRADEGAEERPNERSPEPQVQDPNRSNDGGGGGRPDDAEPGNRRRRRRGRGGDRDRSQQEDTVQGEPSTSRACSTCATRATASSASAATCPSKDDVYVSVKQVRQFGLRKGDRLKGKSRPASRNEKNPALLQIDAVNGDRRPTRHSPAPVRGPHPAVPRLAARTSSWPTTRPT